MYLYNGLIISNFCVDLWIPLQYENLKENIDFLKSNEIDEFIASFEFTLKLLLLKYKNIPFSNSKYYYNHFNLIFSLHKKTFFNQKI